MAPGPVGARLLLRGTAAAAVAGLLAVGAIVPLPVAAAAPTTLTISPLGWNIVGLDSNSPTTASGPARYAIGARVCNTGAADATSVTPTWSWLSSTNTRITLLGAATKPSETVAAGACRSWWWTVDVQRVAASYNTSRPFSITATSANASSVTTPANREIYVEKLISQARNNVTGSSGPTSVYVGGTYTWTFSYDTGTFNQVMAGAFLDPSIFEISSVSQNYSSGGANSQFYYDACGWKNDVGSAGYRSCTTNAKVGGTITSTVTARVTGTGTSTIAPLVLDFSGSSYHYNSDYATSVYALSVTASNPPAPTAAADSATTAVGTQVDVDVLANDAPGAGTLDTGSLTITAGPTRGTATVVAGRVRYSPNPGYAGTDTITYRVCNSFGVCSTALVTVTVAGPPTATADSSTAPTAVATSIDVLANDSSPAGYPLTVTSVGSAAHGTVAVAGGTSVTYTSSAGYHGPDSFTYTISDGQGGSATATVSVTVVNSTPTAVDDSAATASGTPVSIDVVSNDSDPNGDTLAVTSVGSPANGTASVVSGKVTYTPDAGFKGIDSFGYTVSDGFGGSASAVVSVSVANATPIAADDTASTPGGAAVVVPVLDNDTDPNSDSLVPSITTSPSHGSVTVNPDGTVAYVPAAGFRGVDTFTYSVSDGTAASAPATVSITVGNTGPVAIDDTVTTHGPVTVTVLGNDVDANADPLSVTSAGPAGHGTVAVNADGSITYTPSAGFTGEDSFTYTVSDGRGGTSSATVRITVTNAAPVAVDDEVTLARGPGASVTVDALGNDSDPDADPLSIVAAGPASHGSVAIVAGRLVYTPTPGFVGDDVVSYLVSDGYGGTATAVLTVHVTNTAPVALADNASTATGTPVTLDVLGNDLDADSDVLSVDSVSSPAHGSVVLNLDGSVTYTPVAGYRGPDTFTYSVSDGDATSVAATVEITVLNAPPLTQDDVTTTASGTPVLVEVLGNDSDVNSDVLTVTVASIPGHGTAVVNPDGTVTYTPDPGYQGGDSFTYTVIDGAGGSSTSTVTVLVGGAGPVAVDDTATTQHGVAVLIDVLGNDWDPNSGDVLGIETVGAGAHGTTAVLAGTVIYTPAPGFVGSDSFTYAVTDGMGGFASATVTVTVTNLAPTTTADETSVVHGGVVTHDVAANDSDADGDPVTLVSVGGGAHGTATVVAGQVRYSPTPGFVGDDHVSYTVSDGVGGTSTGLLTIHVTNTPPAASDDSVTASSAATVVIDVLANDSDGDGDPLSITLVGPPSSGTAVVAPGGIAYTPASGFSGVATFTYTVGDGHGGTSTATVSVGIPAGPGPGTLVASATARCLADAPFVDYDAELVGGGLAVSAAAPTVSIAWRDGTGRVVASWTGLPASGTLLWPGASVGPDGRGNDWPGWVRSSGVWVPGADGYEHTRAGSSLEMTLGASSASVTVGYPDASSACTARPSMRAVGDSAVTPAGRPVVIPTAANDTGVDVGARVAITGAPAHGTVVVNADGTMTYTPAAGFSGTDTYRYTVTNADGQVSTTTVTVVVQSAPASDDGDGDLPRTGDDGDEGDDPASSPDGGDGASPLPQTGGNGFALLGLGLLLVLTGAAMRRASAG